MRSKSGISDSLLSWQKLLNRAPLLIYRASFDEKRKLLFWNSENVKFIDREVAASQTEQEVCLSQFVASEDQEKVWNSIKSSIVKKNFYQTEYRFFQKDDQAVWVRDQGKLVEDQDETYLEGIIFEIDDLKTTEEKLLFERNKYKTIFDVSGEGIIVVDLKGKILDVNHAVETITGIPKAELKGKNTLQIIKKYVEGKKTNFLFSVVKRAFTGKKILPFEMNFNDVTLEISADYDHQTKRIVGILRDITKRHQIKHSLFISERRFKTIFNSSTDAIMIHDPKDLSILDVNDQACKMYGYSREELKKMNVSDLSSDRMISLDSAQAKKMFSILEKGETVSMEWQGKNKQGKLFWIDIKARFVQFDNMTQMLIFGRDISERKEIEQELKNQRESLQKLVKQRTQKLEEKNIELEKKNRELEKFNKLFVGREYRIKELKDQVRDLEKQLRQNS